jgi:protein Tex
MILEGALSNFAAFGAFIDIAEHGGLVQISATSKTFLKDRREIVNIGPHRANPPSPRRDQR